MQSGDTIAAISSATGPAVRAVVRISGRNAVAIAQSLSALPCWSPQASLSIVRFRNLTIPAWLYVFRAPRSYTGEDLVEFHVPGNPILVKLLLEELLSRGARAAEPGEFTARAYFSGRLDLTEAEGVAATIAAHSKQELAAARQLLAGELARRLAPAMDLLADTLALVEVGIDFSEEDVSFLSRAQVSDRIDRVDAMLELLLRESVRFERLAHEPTVVLVGRPNAGKSTLLNAMSGNERAVVSPVAGTTRDVLWAHVPLRRGIVRMLDVAGLDAEASDPADEIGRQMREHALAAVREADVVVLLIESGDIRPPLPLPRDPDLLVRSKADLTTEAELSKVGAPPQTAKRGQKLFSFMEPFSVSARSGLGMTGLREVLDGLCFGGAASGGTLALNVRHVRAIEEARAALGGAMAQGGGAELLALDLREALDSLGAVLGRLAPDDLLGRIFSRFCIGK